MAIDFYNLFSDLESIGFLDVILPFLLVFTICFAVISKTGILGGKKNISVVISFVIAVLAARSEFFVGFIKGFLPNVAIFMIVILMFLLMLGIFTGENKEWTGIFWGIGAVISLIFVIFSLFFDYTTQYVQFPYWLQDLFYSIDDRTKGIILFLAVLVIVLWLVVREPKEDSDKGSWFRKLLEGPKPK